MYQNVFYFRVINSIGGIESFFYYLAKKYKNYDITIFYQIGDYEQIKRLSKYVRVKKYTGDKIKCNKIFFNFNLDIIDNVEADEYIQIAHGDYKAMNIKPNIHRKIDTVLGCSKQVCKTYTEVTGLDTKLAYNPISIDKPKKVLNLVSATRLTAEKGKSRIVKLANMLNEANIPFIWTIFTDNSTPINIPNVVYLEPKLNIIDYIANADYLVQLSDNEGYCYSVVEALSVGTPVIVTDVPVFKEIGVNSKNGFILDFELDKVPIDKIYKGLDPFEYKPKADSWSKILVKGKSTYQQELKTKVLIKAIKSWYDLELKREVTKGETIEVNKVRADYLIANDVAELLEEVQK